MGGGLSFSPLKLSSSFNSLNSSQNSLNSFKNKNSYLNLLSSYCSNLVLNLLNDKILNSFISITLKGSCLLVDICGFTKFSGDLCCEGVSGIDKLRRTTNLFLSKFIDTVYFYYGDGMLFKNFFLEIIILSYFLLPFSFFFLFFFFLFLHSQLF